MIGLLIEPFYTGSHKQLIDLIHDRLPDSVLVTLPGTKWHWRARTSALVLAQDVNVVLDRSFSKCDGSLKTGCSFASRDAPGGATHSAITRSSEDSANFNPSQNGDEKIGFAFCSSTLNLCELVALCPVLLGVRKILYFHENQLIYPVRVQKQRDYQFGYNQILSCLVADEIWFNSRFNLDSFYSGIGPFLNIQPLPKPKLDVDALRQKSKVVYFPLANLQIDINPEKVRLPGRLRILWPHRWEHDKNPEEFFKVLFDLHSNGLAFDLFVLGECTNDIPPIFEEAKKRLEAFIIKFGYLPKKEEYWTVLRSIDVVVSIANHEFFGVAMLEAVACGAFPLCPNRLVYPEIYPSECLYNTSVQLTKRLKQFVGNPSLAHGARSRLRVDFNRFSIREFLNNF